jgi:hypothetical protein
VGFDVHQATTLATVRESSGKIIARSILPTEEAALLEFFAGMRGAVHVAFEKARRRSGCTISSRPGWRVWSSATAAGPTRRGRRNTRQLDNLSEKLWNRTSDRT